MSPDRRTNSPVRSISNWISKLSREVTGREINCFVFVKMAPYSLFRPLTSVSFEDKAQFSAHQQLIFKRSQQLKLPEIESRRVDVWSIKPPDFSLKLYKSLTVPQRKDRKKGDTSRAVSQPEVTKRRTTVTLPTVLKEGHHRTKEPLKFVTLYRPPDALESELMFVRTGKYPSELYRNPKPHDFRPLDEDLPDIVTTYEKDPGNLEFKLRNLDIIGTTRSESGCTSGDDKSKMDTFKPSEPQWDAKLILPQAPWPPKSASFTRHRRRRGAYSAFLDRVEEKLSKSWKNK